MRDQRNMTPKEALTDTIEWGKELLNRMDELKKRIIEKYGVDFYNRLTEDN